MTGRAEGSFDVEIAPQPPDHPSEAASLGRMTIAKRYRGDLEATGIGTMLTGMTPVEGSAAYVAIEKVEGRLAGRSGSFLLQHAGAMTAASQTLDVTIVPDSGTGELAGIRGRLSIQIEEGRHSYVLDYTLGGTAEPPVPEAPGSPGS